LLSKTLVRPTTAAQINASPAALTYIPCGWVIDRARRAEKLMTSMTAQRQAIGGGAAVHWRRSRVARAAILAAAVVGLVPRLGWAADDPRDAAFLEPILQRVLETTRTDVAVPWRNPATGNGGSIVIERTFYREPDMPCRSFARTVESAGAAPQVMRGTGCRSSTGLWLIEEEPESLAGTPRGTAPVATPAPDTAAVPPHEVEPAAGPTCPDTVLVPLPTERPPALAYTLPSRAEL
jgi:surface antigen